MPFLRKTGNLINTRESKQQMDKFLMLMESEALLLQPRCKLSKLTEKHRARSLILKLSNKLLRSQERSEKQCSTNKV